MMYTPCKLCRKDAAGRAPLNGVGLGDDSEYKGTSKTGDTVTSAASMYNKLMNPLLSLPGISKIAGNINPIAMALAPLTGGLTLIPGVSKLFGNMFSKATHMGDCMKWWSESNIRGMVGSITPYPFDFNDYMMKNFPQFLRQYQIMQAGGQWAAVGIDKLLSNAYRRARIIDEFSKIVHANPDIMTLQCAVQERAETGFTDYSPAQVSALWGKIKESARQKEYLSLVPEIDRKIAPLKVKETWGQIVKSRNENLLVKREQGAALAIPPDIIGVKHGAFIQVLKTGQKSAKPVIFSK